MRVEGYFAAALLGGALIIGQVFGGSPAKAAQAGQAALNEALAQKATGGTTEVGKRRHYRHHRHYRRHHRRPRITFNFGPYYDPYYYGYYPRYSYYPRYNTYPRYRYSRRAGRCGHWRRQCARNWGFGTNSYYGCLRYHGCW